MQINTPKLTSLCHPERSEGSSRIVIASEARQSFCNTPKLRFKEFTNEWQEKKLADSDIKVIDGDRGINYPNGNDFSDSGDCLFLNAKNVTKSGFSFSDVSFISVKKDSALRKGKLEENDLVLTTRGTVGNVAFFDQNVPYKNIRINSGMVILRPDTNKVSPIYLYLFSNSPRLFNQIKRISFGSAQPQLIVKDIQKLKLSIPPINEQEKIADFLTAVDEKIDKLEEKKEGFEKYKKGAMQAIFSQKIRFKKENGGNYPDWEEKKLGELGNIITGATPPTVKREYYDGVFPWITPTDINNEKNIYTSAKFLTQEGIDAGRFVPKNSLLVTCIASIGKNVILKVDGSCNQQINALITNKKNNTDFLYYLLEKNNNILIKFAGAGGMQMLNKKDFSNIRFRIASLEEQEKIADFLTSLDNKVDLINKHLEQAKLFKKSLLQQMFV